MTKPTPQSATANDTAAPAIEHAGIDESYVRQLEAENERLNGVHHADQYTLTLQARENERLRAALRTIGSASDWHPDDMQAFARASCQT